jgi:hypothetical protein
VVLPIAEDCLAKDALTAKTGALVKHVAHAHLFRRRRDIVRLSSWNT